MTQCAVHMILLAFLLRSTKATSSSLRCEQKNDFLKCSCRYDDISNCTTELFTGQDFSGISKFHINCDNGNLSLANFTKLPQGVMLADLTVVQCELTDWQTTKLLPTALFDLKNLTITQSFSADVFPDFGDIFDHLQSFTFYNNYLQLSHDYNFAAYPFQQFDFKFENAVLCQSNAIDKMTTFDDTNVSQMAKKHRCFCTFINISVQLYCFGAHTLDLKNALSAVVNMSQHINPTENRTIISAINLHNLRFLINNSPDSNFDAILNETVPGTDLLALNYSARHPFTFQINTCEQIGNITNATDVWQELQGLLCPLAWMTINATKVSVVNCPHANALMLVDNLIDQSREKCGMLQQTYKLQHLDLSNNNITMDQYVAHFPFQLLSNNLTVFNFSGNSLDTLLSKFFYLIYPRKIRYVDLSFNNLHAVQDNPFILLSSVEWISLAGNTLQYVQHYWFRGLRNLKHLDLSRNQNFQGVWSPDQTYPQIWPESLEHLDLSTTPLTDAEDEEYVGTYGVRFTDRFFMGLSNLLVLNVSHTIPVLSAELFRPLQSLQVLDLTGSFRYFGLPTKAIPKDMLKYLTSLRSLYMGEVLPNTNEVYTDPCEFFKYAAILKNLDLHRSDFVVHMNAPYNDSPPECVHLLRLYSWVLWKKHGTANFTFVEDDKLLCNYNGITYAFTDIHALMANHSGDSNLSLTFNETTAPPPVTTATPIEKRSHPDPPSPQPSLWTQIQLPLFVCLTIVFMVILFCIPTRAMTHAFFQRKHNPDIRRSVFEVAKFTAKHISDKRKHLKQMFFQETLINGFLFAYRSKLVIERLAWYVVIVAFTAILIFQIIGLWQQFYYSDPNTQSTMINVEKFAQKEFTVCFPVRKRNHNQITASDVYAMAEKPICYQHTSLSLPIRNDLMRDMLMFRIGAQMAWEGAILSQNLTITEAMKALDDIVLGRNLSYRHLLTEINGILCDVMQFTASMRNVDSTENAEIILNPAGCSQLLQEQGFGLTWFDLIQTNTACIRFPGLFNFSGFEYEGVFQFQPWQYFYNPVPAKIDLAGYEYPLAAGQKSYSARANLHHDTFLVLQLKSVFRNLATYRSKTNRCYNNCIGIKRVTEIQTKCKCRPLMFAALSDPALPDCTLEIYINCGLSRNGGLKDCAGAVPCELWDINTVPTDNGLTSDNSTIIRFGGINSLYVAYEEQDARTVINFMGDVGGVLGLWLGGSMVAIVHILFFCLKSIYLLLPRADGRKIENKDEKDGVSEYPV